MSHVYDFVVFVCVDDCGKGHCTRKYCDVLLHMAMMTYMYHVG